MKWSWNTRMLTTLGSLFGFIVISILEKSTCKRSIGVVDTIRCRGTLDKLLHAASNVCRTLWISAPDWSFLATRSVPATRTVYGHTLGDLHLSGTQLEWQHSAPWGPQRADLQFCPWALTTGTRPPDELHNYANSCSISLPPSLEACFTRCVLRFVCFCTFSQSSTALNIVSSLWALAQVVTCISTNGQSAVTHTACSKCWSPSTMARSWTLAPVWHFQADSIKDGSHCFWVQLSGNLAKDIYHHIIMPLLVLQLC